jgi:hypothetical protein
MASKISFLFVCSLASLLLVSCGNSADSSISNSEESSPTTSSAYSSSQPVSSLPTSALSKTATTLYVDTDGGTETQDVNLYFVDGKGDIPFLSMDELVDILDRVSNDILVKKDDHIVTIYRSENTATIVIDFQMKTVTYDNLDLFAAGHGKNSVLNLVSDLGTTEAGAPKYLKSMTSSGLDYNRPGKSFSVSLPKYNIPTYFENGVGYLPVQTVSDLLMSQKNVYVRFNGAALFMSGATTFSSDMTDKFFSVSTGTRSAQMARFCRDELALALDFQYGLKDEHEITDFDTFFKQTGLDNEILSTDPIVSSRGVARLLYSDFTDYHSAFDSPSAYAGKDALTHIKEDDYSIYSPTYQEYQLIRSAFQGYRTKIFSTLYQKSKPDIYYTYSKTAIITFDSFTMPSQDYYKTPATSEATDTFGILEYAHSQIVAAGNAIQNVVLDLSCNSGGSINAGVYVAGWFLPDGILSVKNTLTGSLGSYTYQSDLNMDGQYTKDDRLSSKKLYCLVSPASFSCSNFVTSLLKESDQVRIIGRKTGGGACIVQHLSLADGSFIQTSGNRKLCNPHNGTFTSIDQGVDVDYTIDSYLGFYNREDLVSTIESLS